MQEHVDMTTQSTLSNRVLVRLDPENDKIETKSGFKFDIDTSYEPEKHVVRLGTVEAVPERLNSKNKDLGLMWETDMEIKVGDRVIMYFLAVQNCLSKEQKCYVRENGTTKIYVKYNNIYAAIRDGKVFPVNGYVFVEPTEDPSWEKYVERCKLLNMEAVDMREPSKSHVTFGKVAYLGKPIKKYHASHKTDDGYDLEVGDTVVMKRIRDIPVEYEYHAKIDGGRKLYRMQRNDILAKI